MLGKVIALYQVQELFRTRANMIILTCLLFLPAIFGNTGKNETTFVPTNEWQTVRNGTHLPKGLHIRYNFQTGVTEAKLIDSEDMAGKGPTANLNSTNTNSLTLHPEKAIFEDKDPVPIEKPDLFNLRMEELSAKLKKIGQDNRENVPELNDEHTQRIKQKFRNYETLKKEFDELEINITTGSELLSNYIQKFQSHKNAVTMGTLTRNETEEVLDILYNLEFLVHHIDNAKVFADMQGMSIILSPCLNGTNTEIKTEALRLLGAAVQSNPIVQLKALENDFVQKLLYILTTNHQIKLKSMCLFALSALIRGFPAAQKVWWDHGGVEIFGKILVHDLSQLQIKVMKLVTDLLVERRDLSLITDIKQRKQKELEYAAVNIENKLLTCEYCKHLINLMMTNIIDNPKPLLETDKSEFMVTIADSIINSAYICEDQFNEKIPTWVSEIAKFYRNLNSLKATNSRDEL